MIIGNRNLHKTMNELFEKYGKNKVIKQLLKLNSKRVKRKI